MIKNNERRNFIKTTTLVSVGLGVGIKGYSAIFPKTNWTQEKRVGIIGLDTSHCIVFTKILNVPNPEPDIAGYRVVAAYPWGSPDIESSSSRIPGYIEEIRTMGVQIVDSIADLLEKVDVILLETSDGRLHREQALQVFKAGKPVFIDKPVAASLSNVISIY